MLRVCDACGGVDEGPRHQRDFTGSEAPAPKGAAVLALSQRTDLDEATKVALLDQLTDTTVQHFHMDCCAASGCATCIRVHQLAPGSDVAAGQELTVNDGVTRNEALLAFIQSGAVDTVGAETSEGNA